MEQSPNQKLHSEESALVAEFGVVANALESESLLRNGARCWVVGGWTGGGYERLQVYGCSHGGRRIEKWSARHHFTDFRVAWIPPNLRRTKPHMHPTGTRKEMERKAAEFAAAADRLNRLELDR